LAVLAGVIGGLAGIVGFLPFFLLSGKARKRFLAKGKGAFGFTLLIPLLSFVLLIAQMVCGWFFLRDYLLVFAAACVIVFLVATGTYTITQAKRLR